MPSTDSEKTSRIGMLCLTLAFLGILVVLSKANACSLACNSCNSPDKKVECKDEFYEFRNDGYGSNHTCTPGARVEVVSSPPAAKPGIMCHCADPPTPTPTPSFRPGI